MKTFNLEATVTISIYTEVEAETLEEAIEIANERTIEASQWRNEEQIKECWLSDEYDGSPEKIKEAKLNIPQPIKEES